MRKGRVEREALGPASRANPREHRSLDDLCIADSGLDGKGAGRCIAGVPHALATGTA
jgi:hypothetical protein